MWGGRFQKAEERSALDFNASVSYDCRMYKEDIAGSLAHASMLADRGIISKEDLEKDYRGGLLKIKKRNRRRPVCIFRRTGRRPYECGKASDR